MVDTEGSISMLTRPEERSDAGMVGKPSSGRLRGWARRRGRQFVRIFLAFSSLVLVIVSVALIWRGVCLFNLPDVGDPFTVQDVDEEKIPDERNAFVYFREAMAKLRPMPDASRAGWKAAAAVGWSKTEPKIREWVEENREALEVFRRGCEQVDGVTYAAECKTLFTYPRYRLGHFALMALLEGSRLEEGGDLVGAWAWYRGVLGMRVHVMRGGTVFERLFAQLNSKGLRPRVSLWAADPRTTVSDLRRALEDVIRCEPRPEWEASSLKLDYQLMMGELDRPDGVLSQGEVEEQAYRIGGEPLPPNLRQAAFSLRQFLIHEPERSRRVLRLAFANWLAHVENPDERNRRPAIRVSFLSWGQSTSLFFYDAGPARPKSARSLPAAGLAAWLLAAPDARLLLNQWPWPSIGLQERREHRSLLILLAEELYRRERGRLPFSEQELVGSYLKSLPDVGGEGFEDATTKKVEEVRP